MTILYKDNCTLQKEKKIIQQNLLESDLQHVLSEHTLTEKSILQKKKYICVEKGY